MVFDLAITGPAGPDTQAKRCEGFGFIFVVPPNSRISNQKYKNRNPSPVAVTGVLAEVGRAGLCAGAGRPAAEGVAAVSILQRARVVAVRGGERRPGGGDRGGVAELLAVGRGHLRGRRRAARRGRSGPVSPSGRSARGWGGAPARKPRHRELAFFFWGGGLLGEEIKKKLKMVG